MLAKKNVGPNKIVGQHTIFFFFFFFFFDQKISFCQKQNLPTNVVGQEKNVGQKKCVAKQIFLEKKKNLVSKF